MKYLIIVDTEKMNVDLSALDWNYIAKVKDEDYDKVTEAIEGVTDK